MESSIGASLTDPEAGLVEPEGGRPELEPGRDSEPSNWIEFRLQNKITKLLQYFRIG